MIKIIPKVLTESECSKILHDTDPINTATDDFYFQEVDNKYGLKKVKCSDNAIVKNVISKLGLNVESVSLLYYPTGAYNPSHADNSVNVNGVYTKYKEWTHTAILYLNNNFTGGELIYPEQGCVFLPTIGTLIITPADEDYCHFVTPVTSGERFTLVFRIL